MHISRKNNSSSEKLQFNYYWTTNNPFIRLYKKKLLHSWYFQNINSNATATNIHIIKYLSVAVADNIIGRVYQ